MSFTDPQREGYKFHYLVGSVDELSGDKAQWKQTLTFKQVPSDLPKSSRHVTSHNWGTLGTRLFEKNLGVLTSHSAVATVTTQTNKRTSRQGIKTSITFKLAIN